MDKNSLAHTKWNCKYHIIITLKYRRKIIYQRISKNIGSIIRTLCARKGVEIIEASGDAGSYSSLRIDSAEVRGFGFYGLSQGKK